MALIWLFGVSRSPHTSHLKSTPVFVKVNYVIFKVASAMSSRPDKVYPFSVGRSVDASVFIFQDPVVVYFSARKVRLLLDL
jgi:hypothetical protein